MSIRSVSEGIAIGGGFVYSGDNGVELVYPKNLNRFYDERGKCNKIKELEGKFREENSELFLT